MLSQTKYILSTLNMLYINIFWYNQPKILKQKRMFYNIFSLLKKLLSLYRMNNYTYFQSFQKHNIIDGLLEI